MSPPPTSSLLDFRGKTVLVTGAGRGIGAGVARRFAEAGARVVVHYRNSPAQAEAVVGQIHQAGGQALAVQADVTAEDDVARLFEAARAAFGRLDVLINNAGVYPLHSLLEMTAQHWDEVVNANLRSIFLCTQAFAKQVVAASHDSAGSGGAAGGAIVNITSIEAENPAPMHSHYVASKAGVLMFTRASAGELGVHGIRVNAVAPGLMWREGIEQAWPDGVARYVKAAPLQRLGQPDDVADACLFLASPAARWITGASLTVDGGVMTHPVF